jgi:RNA recognition motif-containing protein|mmetsp:Transcript_5427/g.8819  ORF Transcript_5427/g.8819 Transcript_5427/m.8819 type:complete len:224 (+) Transcript_5427:68-739(+)|eukprot:CAMPEP_0169115186 /NCGR_PEP_ID=MMETSP1015-20121227/29202_1 /TAXON_ID=342587 /ORGANISM="Karlodinium micrum, Strain CCMP2283" /LENGTH=223 /DNA_ID=CAMNT_0009177609 /DNA_START=65 /DNA_END=736 /DNA_ORIENTATION=+
MTDGSTLHVTGLPKGITEDQVKELFVQYGAIKSLRILPEKDDKPDAAAIVSMETSEQAKLIIDNVDGKNAPGSTLPLVIKKKFTNSWNKGMGKGYGMYGYGQIPPWAMMQMMAYYKGKGKGKGFGGGSSGGLSSFPAEKKVWIGGLPEEGVTFRELQAHFPGAKFATVMKGKAAGTGGVAFGTAEEAAEAIAKYNGSVLAGATLVVDVWTKKEPAATTQAESL